MLFLENGADFESREAITGIPLQGVETSGVVNKQIYAEEVSCSFIYVAMSSSVLAYGKERLQMGAKTARRRRSHDLIPVLGGVGFRLGSGP
jgi:hypothetical protein